MTATRILGLLLLLRRHGPIRALVEKTFVGARSRAIFF
jgi:hypothetical protein